MADEKDNPPILPYQRPVPGGNARAIAGIALMFWSCPVLLAALPPTAIVLWDIVMIFRVSPESIYVELLVLFILGLLGYGLIRFGIYLIKTALRLLNHQPVNIDPLISGTLAFETLAYLSGFVVILLFCLLSWHAFLLAAPSFAMGGALTLTRILLRRVKYV